MMRFNSLLNTDNAAAEKQFGASMLDSVRDDVLAFGLKAVAAFTLLLFVLVTPVVFAGDLLIFEDQEGRFSPEQILAQSDELFVKRDSHFVGYSPSTWWLKIRKSDVSKYLHFKESNTTHVDLVYSDSSGIKVVESGYSVPVSERDIAALPFLFNISKIDAQWFYLRIKSTYVIYLEVEQLNETQYQVLTMKHSVFVGMAFGALLLLSLYNAMLWINTKDRMYGYYLIYSFGTVILSSAMLGLFTLSESLSHLSVALYVFGGMPIYVGSFLLMKEIFAHLRSRVIEHCSNAGIWLAIVTVTGGLAVSDAFALKLYAYYGIGIVVSVLLISILVIALRADHPFARPMALGWMIWVAGTFVLMGHLLGFGGYEAKYVLVMASLAEGIIFSIVLAVRHKIVEQEALAATWQSEQALTQLAASQQHEAELQALVDELQVRREKQAQIFSIIGHELRTPLSSMKMMEEAMELRNIGGYGANICESTDAVLNIVDDLRTVINPDKAHLAQAVVESPFDVLTRTTKSLEGLYEQQGVEVIVTSNQLAHSLCKFNAQALRQKITNLTKNAAIHADADTVWVDLQAQPNGGDKVDLTLIVEDNGKGIPEGLREAVFGAFSRGDTRADGTGLGLYITRELAGKLGGTVEYFESEKGGAGFRVNFTLDLFLNANEQEQVDEAIPVALQGKRILFAEDQKTLQLLTSKLLKDAGAEVVVCDNGKQALEAFRAGEFDIVLTDLMMPEMNGDELIRHIRADGFTGQVVALTAAIIGKETDRLLEAGADAVLNKPLDIHAMKRTIAGLAMKGSAA